VIPLELTLINAFFAIFTLVGAVCLIGLRFLDPDTYHPLLIRMALVMSATVGLVSAIGGGLDGDVAITVRLLNATLRGATLLLVWSLVLLDASRAINRDDL